MIPYDGKYFGVRGNTGLKIGTYIQRSVPIAARRKRVGIRIRGVYFRIKFFLQIVLSCGVKLIRSGERRGLFKTPTCQICMPGCAASRARYESSLHRFDDRHLHGIQWTPGQASLCGIGHTATAEQKYQHESEYAHTKACISEEKVTERRERHCSRRKLSLDFVQRGVRGKRVAHACFNPLIQRERSERT